MKKNDRLTSLIGLGLAVAFVIASSLLPFGSWNNPGPGFLPLASSIALGVFSILAYLEADRKPSKIKSKLTFSRKGLKDIFLVVASLCGYAVLMGILGFPLTTFFLFVLLFRKIEPRQRWIPAIVGSALLSFGFYALFQWALKVGLP